MVKSGRERERKETLEDKYASLYEEAAANCWVVGHNYHNTLLSFFALSLHSP